MSAPDEIIWQIINHQFCSFKSKYVQKWSLQALFSLPLPSPCSLSPTSQAHVSSSSGIMSCFSLTMHYPTNSLLFSFNVFFLFHLYPFLPRINAKEQTFCRNPYNVTGLCLRSACPLANSRYATIREEEGHCYLLLKTAERAHTPAKLWEKVRLPTNYAKALEKVSKELEFFPKYLQHRNKQRLTKIHQYLIRMRKLKLKVNKPKLVGIHKKVLEVLPPPLPPSLPSIFLPDIMDAVGLDLPPLF